MEFTALERVLWPERARLYAARSLGFGIPVMHEHAMPGAAGPYLVTGASGKFLPTARTRDGLIRCGLFPCPPSKEDGILPCLMKSLQVHGVRCTPVQDAAPMPKFILMSADMAAAAGADPDAVLKLSGFQGNVDAATNLKNLTGSSSELSEAFGWAGTLPDSSGKENGSTQIVVTRVPLPWMLWVGPNAGVHFRSGEHLGLILSLPALSLVEAP